MNADLADQTQTEPILSNNVRVHRRNPRPIFRVIRVICGNVFLVFVRMVLMRLALLIIMLVAGAGKAGAQSAEKPAPSAEKPKEEDLKPSDSHKRIELNLLGKTDADAGESRRNENIQFNLVDNNALKELNVRLGTTATIIREFSPASNYFGAEFGNPPAQEIG